MKAANRMKSLFAHSTRLAWYAGAIATALILFGGIGIIGAFFLSRGHW